MIAGMRMNTQINVQKAISIHSGVIRAVVLHIQILAALLCEGSTTGIEVVVVLGARTETCYCHRAQKEPALCVQHSAEATIRPSLGTAGVTFHTQVL